jgi:uncharacterized protein with HEPN domain
MKKNDDQARLGHIYDAILKIEKYIQNINFDTFLSNEMMQDAVIRQLEIIGEATRYISDGLKDENPGLPWFEMRGIRNKIVHDYLEVNQEIIWDTIQNDLPAIKPMIKDLLGESNPTE